MIAIWYMEEPRPPTRCTHPEYCQIVGGRCYRGGRGARKVLKVRRVTENKDVGLKPDLQANDYLPLNTGGRFSRKARAASAWSCVKRVRVRFVASMSNIASNRPS